MPSTEMVKLASLHPSRNSMVDINYTVARPGSKRIIEYNLKSQGVKRKIFESHMTVPPPPL
jgi:hypothetical protein